MAEVLVPDHVARLGLRVGPLEDDGRAAVAHHDAVLGELVERLGRLDHVARRVHRRASTRRVLGELRQLVGVGLDQRSRGWPTAARGVSRSASTSCGTTPRRSPTSGTSNRPVDADGGRVLLDVHPFAVGIVAGPVLGPAVVHRLTEFGTQRDAQVGFLDCLVRGRGEQVRERPVLQPRDERRAAGGLDDRAGHQLGEFLDLAPGCATCERRGPPAGSGSWLRGSASRPRRPRGHPHPG